MTDAVRIAVRCRPSTKKELSDNEHVADMAQLKENVLVVENKHKFVFNKVFEPDTPQAGVYQELIKPLVERTFDGYYCTVLAYGQTGTGKTFTMGLENELRHGTNAGMVSRALIDIFNMCQKSANTTTNVSISFIEIYTDKVYDLLSTDPKKQIFVKGQKFGGAKMQAVFNLSDAQKILIEGSQRRQTRPTTMNSNSSRSHAIFSIEVEKRGGDKVTISSLRMVDLAGSEGVRRTNHDGPALTEGVHINKGLLSISNVIKAISRNNALIPYRDSVLSSVLQDSLNAKSFLTLLACISPLQKDLSETLSTLRFAQNAATLKITPQINAMVASHKKLNTIVDVSKTPFPRKLGDYRPIAQSTAVKSHQTLRRSHSFVQPRQFFCSNIPKKTSTGTRIDSFDDTKRLEIDNSHMKLSGCSSLESSLESTISEQAPTLPAIKNPNQFVNPQPSTSMSPMFRRVISEYTRNLKSNLREIVTETFEEKFKSFAVPTLAEQAPRPTFDVLRTGSIDNAALETTILLSEEMDETVMVPSDPEEMVIVENDRNITYEPSMLEPRPTIVYPYESSMEESKSDETICDEIDQSGQIGIPLSNVLSLKATHQRTIELAPLVASFESAPILPHSRAFSTPEIPSGVRRSRRLTILNERKRAQAVEESTLHEHEVSLAQNRLKGSCAGKRPRVFQDVTQKVAYMTNITHCSSTPHRSKAVGRDKNIKKKATAKKEHRTNILRFLNNASEKELQTLPQIGEKTAYSLFTYRNLKGPFTDIESMAKLKFWSGKHYERFVECNNLR